MLSTKEIEAFEYHLTDSKKDMKVCQAIRMRYDSSWEYSCMCSKINRKVFRKDFNQWYEQITGRQLSK